MLRELFEETNPLRVLLIDDNPADRRLVLRVLRQAWPDVVAREVATREDFEAAVQEGDFDLVLTDYRLRWGNGLEVLERVQALYPHKPVLLVTDSGSEELAAQAMHLGAAGYVLKKPAHLQRLPEMVRAALEGARARSLSRYLNTLYQHLPVGVFHADEQGCLRLFNPAFQALLGVSTPQQAVGKRLTTWVHDEDREALEALLRRLGPEPQTVEVRWGGAPLRWVRLTLWRNNVLGETALIYGTAEEVTERVQREKGREMWLQTAQSALGMEDPERGLMQLLQWLLHWVGAQLVALYWYDAETNTLHLGPRAADVEQLLHTLPALLAEAHPLAEACMQHQGEVLCFDAQHPAYAHLRLSAAYRYVMALPLHREQKPIGLVLFIRTQDPPFTERNIWNVLSFLGLLVALVGEIHYRQVLTAEHRRLQAYSERLWRLHQAATHLAAAQGQAAVWAALEQALAGLGLHYLAFRVVDDTLQIVTAKLSGESIAALERELGRPLAEVRVPLAYWPQAAETLSQGGGLWGQVHAADLERLTKQLNLPPRWVYWMGLNGEGVPMTLLPLYIGGAAWGLLVVWGQGLVEEDRPLLETLGRQVEVALEKAALLERTLRRAQRMSALVHLSAQLAGAQSAEEIAHLLVNGLHAELGYRYVRMYRLDPETGDRVLAAQHIAPELHATVPLRLRAGYGLSHRAVVEKRQIYTPDVRQEALYVPGLGRGSEVETPILVGEQVYGVLIVAHPETHAFDREDLEMLSAVGHMAGVALEKVHLLTAERRRANVQEQLRNVLLDLTSELDLERLGRWIVQRAQTVAHAQGVALWLPQPPQGIWKRVAVVGHLPEAGAQPTLPQAQGQDAALLGDPVGAPLRLTPYHWWIPLTLRGQVVGWLECVWNETGWNPLEYHLVLSRSLMLFGVQAAVALENARLFHTTEKQAHTTATLYRAARRIAHSTLDPEVVYQTVYQAVRETIGGDAFLLARYDPQSRLLTLAFGVEGEQRLPVQHLPLNETLLGHVVTTGQSILIRHLGQEAGQLPFTFRRWGQMMNSVLAVPLPGRQGPTGAISVQAARPYAFDEEDQRLLEMLASHTAVALENAMLFEQTHQMAITDELTGLYNRRQLFNLGAREVQRARRFNRPLSAVMMDLDDFKRINDTYGHAVGDEVLRQWAQRVAQSIRDIDVLGRYGGEEFALVLPETRLDAAVRLAERLRQLVSSRPFVTSAGPLRLTMSLGVAAWHPQLPSIQALFREADQALYLAKRSGKNRTAWKQVGATSPRLLEPES